MNPPRFLKQLRNTSVQGLIRALERDGFSYQGRRGATRLYRHLDGRRALIHFHHGGDTLPIGSLRAVLRATMWDEAALRRLKLIK